MPDIPDDPAQTERTRDTLLRYHISWKYRDLDAVMALYHPEVGYNDFFLNRSMGLAELRDYLLGTMPRHPDEALAHTDRIRIDGHTAFIQYRTRPGNWASWRRICETVSSSGNPFSTRP